jgi:photosynthetic reaction center cytochrome c subunit
MTMRPLTLGLLAGTALATLGGCERPPVDSEQLGYRGTGMVQVSNPRLAASQPDIPAAIPPVPQGGPTAGELLQNVQVLGDLSVAEFTRTMNAITTWVSPEQGCDYCHVSGDRASEDIYTKVVSRRMLQMTQAINRQWGDHVGQTGVTCFTCHRGQNVPANIWFADDSAANASHFAGNRAGQNRPAESVGLASLPADPFSSLLTSTGDDVAIRVQTGPFPENAGPTIHSAEATYGLMMHISGALGVNCTYCHNTASFGNWEGSRPTRVKAYHGIQMVQDLNEHYLVPLGPVYPENRLGPAGDPPKAFCTTCHAGQAKPLNGAKMAVDYPAFARD